MNKRVEMNVHRVSRYVTAVRRYFDAVINESYRSVSQVSPEIFCVTVVIRRTILYCIVWNGFYCAFLYLLGVITVKW